MISKIEENEYDFTKLWSHGDILECGTLFANQNLPNDPFFNKFTNVTCQNEKMIDEILFLFRKYNTRPFVCVLDNLDFEKFLHEKKFTVYDIQHVFKKSFTPDAKDLSVRRITKKDSFLWSEIFCKSFDCYDWIDEVNYIVRNSLDKIEYLIDEKYNASCVALYEKHSMLGLYCLGVLPEKRKNGLAKLLTNYALNLVKKRNLDFLMLETYEHDNLLEFYSKLGFENVYKKKIYTI